MSDRIENALRELRAEYWDDIRSYAQEITSENSGREAIDDAVWDTCDGSAWIIYTARAQIVLLCSDNCDAWEELGAESLDPAMIWSQMAFHAMRADLMEHLDAIDDDDDDDEPGRTHYRNGDEIGLLTGCDGCNPSMINGVLCHESGCPDAWRDEARECDWCGTYFNPADRHQVFCDESCAESMQ